MEAHRSKRKLFVLEMYLLGRDVVGTYWQWNFLREGLKKKKKIWNFPDFVGGWV